MQKASGYRFLTNSEARLARGVFKETIKYSRVAVSDALGYDDRHFTLHASIRVPFMSNVKGADYVLNVGKYYHGFLDSEYGRNLLIHELVHVWQGEHGANPRDFVYESAWYQALEALGAPDAYGYDAKNLEEWDEYNVEAQASIVEGWFAKGMHHDKNRDLRFYYVKKHIWGEKTDYNWLNDQWVIKPIEVGRLPEELWAPQYPPTDAMLLKHLRKRFKADDVKGYGERLRAVEKILRETSPRRAREYADRFRVRIAGDELSELFKDHLETSNRESLLRILRAKAPH